MSKTSTKEATNLAWLLNWKHKIVCSYGRIHQFHQLLLIFNSIPKVRFYTFRRVM